MLFQRRRKCIFHWRGRAGLTIWDRVKIPWYSHKLMHRKRVTCELYDSYFCSMTIKHAIPRTAEVTHPDGQLLGDTEWAIELLYNSVKTGSQWVWRPVGEKMLEWEHVPERLGPQALGWAVQENENDTRLCSEGLGRSICCSSVRSPTPSHTQTFQIKWEVYVSKNCVTRLYYCVNMYSACICVCIFIIWLYNIIICLHFFCWVSCWQE